jgi:putative addiction module component (TIGR02574 family)
MVESESASYATQWKPVALIRISGNGAKCPVGALQWLGRAVSPLNCKPERVPVQSFFRRCLVTSKVTELLQSALLLSPPEREELADCLWASLDPPDGFADMTEEELVAELNRRAAELKADPGVGESWDEIRNVR